MRESGAVYSVPPGAKAGSVPSLCYALGHEPPVFRAISYCAAQRGVNVVDCPSLDALIVKIALERPDLVLVNLELDGSDAIEVMRSLEETEFSGRVHLMGHSDPDLLNSLVDVGVRRGLFMGASLTKPFRRAAIDSLFEDRPHAHTDAPSSSFRALAPQPRDGARLRQALDAGAIDTVYQPRFDLDSCRTYGAEVFARHADTGECLLSRYGSTGDPADVDRLTELMLKTALCAWHRFARPSFSPLFTLRVPVSSLARIPVGDIIRRSRPEHAEWPGLVMELIETELAEQPARVRELAAQLKLHGLRISIGDFGTGHTALDDLGQFRPHELTVNRLFVKNCSESSINAAFCSSIIRLAQSLGARAVGEGVETLEDLHMLRKLGCDAVQGDALAPPLHVHEFDEFIARGEILSLSIPRSSSLQHLRLSQPRLSTREIEVLELLAAGQSSKQAGASLGLSPRTIDVYRAKLMAKLNARNVAELVKVALTSRK